MKTLSFQRKQRESRSRINRNKKGKKRRQTNGDLARKKVHVHLDVGLLSSDRTVSHLVHNPCEKKWPRLSHSLIFIFYFIFMVTRLLSVIIIKCKNGPLNIAHASLLAFITRSQPQILPSLTPKAHGSGQLLLAITYENYCTSLHRVRYCSTFLFSLFLENLSLIHKAL